MRFKVKDYGDRRIVKRFVLFPICLRVDLRTDRKEWRWLEVVYIRQRVDCGQFHKVWKNTWFETREEYLKYKEDKHA